MKGALPSIRCRPLICSKERGLCLGSWLLCCVGKSETRVVVFKRGGGGYGKGQEASLILPHALAATLDVCGSRGRAFRVRAKARGRLARQEETTKAKEEGHPRVGTRHMHARPPPPHPPLFPRAGTCALSRKNPSAHPRSHPPHKPPPTDQPPRKSHHACPFLRPRGRPPAPRGRPGHARQRFPCRRPQGLRR